MDGGHSESNRGSFFQRACSWLKCRGSFFQRARSWLKCRGSFFQRACSRLKCRGSFFQRACSWLRYRGSFFQRACSRLKYRGSFFQRVRSRWGYRGSFFQRVCSRWRYRGSFFQRVCSCWRYCGSFFQKLSRPRSRGESRKIRERGRAPFLRLFRRRYPASEVIAGAGFDISDAAASADSASFLARFSRIFSSIFCFISGGRIFLPFSSASFWSFSLINSKP